MKRLLLPLALTLLWSMNAFAVTAHVQTVSTAWTISNTIAQIVTTTGGNLTIVSVHFHANNSGNSVTGVTDDKGNTYTEIDRIEASTGGQNVGTVDYYAKNITGGVTVVTATFITNVIDRALLVVEEVSGADTTAPLNVHAGQSQTNPGTATDGITSTAVTASAGDYVFAACTDFFSGSPELTKGTGYTDGISGVAHYATEYIPNYGGGSKAGTFTTTDGTIDYRTVVAMFKAAGGGGGATCKGALTLLGAGGC